MSAMVAFFRGINVGGKNILPMAALRATMESLNCEDVKTYIQSGNVTFRSRVRNTNSLRTKIADQINAQHGFRPELIIMTHSRLEAAIDANPFPDATATPSLLSYFFLDKPAVQADLGAIEESRAKSEQFQLTDRVFYLYAPDGFGRSKLARNAERMLKVVVTARNHRTVVKLLELAHSG